jgi:hypothetical protein
MKKRAAVDVDAPALEARRVVPSIKVRPEQKTEVVSFAALWAAIDARWGLDFPQPELTQLKNVLTYLEPVCESAIREHHYIDRHYMEDHGAFYARSFAATTNFCERIHFFQCDERELEARLLQTAGSSADTSELNRDYLGFMVLKPLPGTPVGRTVLRPRKNESDRSTVFFAQRGYDVHIGGVTITAEGIAFQEQDVGVSVCATMSIWSSLQQLKHEEQFGVATPAEISSLAQTIRVPPGRASIASGLSVEEMCRAVNALGLTAQVIATRTQIDVIRFVLHTSLRSQFAPVLLISVPGQTDGHAITATGIRLGNPLLASAAGSRAWGRISGLYVHDDRVGPYVEVSLGQRYETVKSVSGAELKRLVTTVGPLRGYIGDDDVDWDLFQILLPLNSQIKLPLPELKAYITELIEAISEAVPVDDVDVDCRIVRPHVYLKESLLAKHDAASALDFQRGVAVPRYTGVVSISSPTIGEIDVLVDMTSTPKNEVVVAIVCQRHRRNTDDAIDALKRFTFEPHVYMPPIAKRVTRAR